MIEAAGSECLQCVAAQPGQQPGRLTGVASPERLGSLVGRSRHYPRPPSARPVGPAGQKGLAGQGDPYRFVTRNALCRKPAGPADQPGSGSISPGGHTSLAAYVANSAWAELWRPAGANPP